MEKQKEQARIEDIIEVISDFILQCINNNDKDVSEYVKDGTNDGNNSQSSS
ncbi:hypothetical protein [Clostridium butyricum]|uniref:hypothetical protein n=1 Tax=Clostridium butyricum TaxID=1492 RepID=UPI002ABE4560|nr:hypothetical protein [Clostridium butyricum]